MEKITTLGQLQILINNTMVYAAVVALVSVFVAYLISMMIPYSGGTDKSYVKRRIAYIIVGIVGPLAFFLYNDLYVKSFIMNAGFKDMFVTANLKCLGITLGGYIVVGLILMFAFRNSKFGSILGKGKE